MPTEEAIETARQELREKIVTLTSSSHFDEPDELAHAVHPILAEILDALEQLDDGEAPLAFRPSVPSHKSVKSAEVARLRLRAVAYIFALKHRNIALPDALARVAEAFQRGEDAVSKWRLAEIHRAQSGDGTVRRNADLTTLVGIDKFAHKMGHGLSIKQIIKKAQQDGERLKILQPNYSKVPKK